MKKEAGFSDFLLTWIKTSPTDIQIKQLVFVSASTSALLSCCMHLQLPTTSSISSETCLKVCICMSSSASAPLCIRLHYVRFHYETELRPVIPLYQKPIRDFPLLFID